MRTKRYILTSIALLLVTIMCAGLAFAADATTKTPKFTCTGGGDGKAVEDGGTITVPFYFHGGKPVAGDTLKLSVKDYEPSELNEYYWVVTSDEEEEVATLEIPKTEDQNKDSITLKVNRPGTALIEFYGKYSEKAAEEDEEVVENAGSDPTVKGKVLASVTIDLTILPAKILYTDYERKADYSLQPGGSIDFIKEKYFMLIPDDIKAGTSYTWDDVDWKVEAYHEDGKAATAEDEEAAKHVKIKNGVLTVDRDATFGKVLVKAGLKVYAGLDEKGKIAQEVEDEDYVYSNWAVVVGGIGFECEDNLNRTFYYSKEDGTTDVNKSVAITGYYKDKDESAASFKWSSSDPSVVEVTENETKLIKGSTKTTVTLKKPGKAIITATALDAKGKEVVGPDKKVVSNTFSVDLKEIEATGISFSTNYPYPIIEAVVGSTLDMRALASGPNDKVGKNYFVVAPTADCSYSTRDFEWSVNDTSYASITKAGILTGIAKATPKDDAFKVTATLTMKTSGKKFTTTVPVRIIEGEEVERPLTELSFTKKEIVLEKGNSDILTNYLSKTPVNSDSELVWKSSDDSIVKVYEDGTIWAENIGSAIITVTSKDNETVYAQISVVVKEKEEDKPVAGVKFKAESYKLWVDQTDILDSLITMTPSRSTPAYVVFTSSNPEVAYVYTATSYWDDEPYYYVKGLSEGKATITATVRNFDGSSVTADVEFVVTEYAISGMAFAKNEYALTIGSREETTLNLKKRLLIKPNDYLPVIDGSFADDLIVWSSNKTRIATVDASGLVTAHAPGEVTIYAVSAKDKNIGAQVTLKIEGRAASKIKLSKDEMVFEEGQDLTSSFKMTVQPANAYIKEVSYKFSTTGIAEVVEGSYNEIGEYYGKPVVFNVRALGKVGETWLTVTAVNETAAGKEEELTAKVKMIFKAPAKNLGFEKKAYTVPIFVNKKLNKTSLKVVDKDTGKVYTGALSWSSSNKDVATVAKNGQITVKAEGETEITATTKDGNKTAVKTKLTVKKWGITKLTGSTKQMMSVGDKVNIKEWVTVKPVGKVYNDKLILKSLNKDIVMVDSQGNISALKAGEATITVTAKDDTTKTKTIKVTVVEKKEKK